MDLLFGLGKTVLGRLWLGSCVATLVAGWCVMRIAEDQSKWAGWVSPEGLLWAVTLPAAVFAFAHFALIRRLWFAKPVGPTTYARIIRVAAQGAWVVGVAVASFIFVALWWKLLGGTWRW
jgi:hypothetical protein